MSKPKSPTESKNTLKSVAKGHIIDLIGYGPVKGLVTESPLQSVYLDDTPIENSDGTLNFQGIDFEFRYGDPEQTVIDGFDESSAPREINVKVIQSAPVTRYTVVPEVDAVEITIMIPALVYTDSKGNTKAHDLPFNISIEDAEGVNLYDRDLKISGKNTSPYERTYRYELNTGTAPYKITVSRRNKESDEQKTRDELVFYRLTEIISVKHSYPGCVLAGIAVDSEYFGGSMPSRKYLMDLSIIKVPSNYDPETREYSGIWDGTFKQAWTDNPAWCFYDLATHPIVGAGIQNVNKWALYEIAKYCDEIIDDGFGGKEPRFTCNTVLSSTEDAITALGNLATVFRGMSFWNSDELLPIADMPTPIRKVITPSDVIEGEFTYEGTSLKDRHSVVIVNWIDPDDGYIEKPERVEDPEALELVGWREKEIRALACTSRGQARRLGLWALYAEKEESDTVTFRVPVKHSDFRPGDCFFLQDPYRAGVRLGGRLASVDGIRVTLDYVDEDSDIQIRAGWQILLQTESGGMLQRRVIAINGKVVTLNEAVDSSVVVGASFSTTSPEVGTPIFRVAVVTEKEGDVYEVRAAPYDPNKYDRIEKGLTMPEVPETFIPTGLIKSPKYLSAELFTYEDGNYLNQGITIGWTPPDDARASNYILEARGPGDIAFGTIYRGPGVSFDLKGIEAGKWYFRVKVHSENWGSSQWLERQFTFESGLRPSGPISLMFSSDASSIVVMPVAPSPFFEYEFEFYRSEEALALSVVESNATYIGTGRTVTDGGLKFNTRYYYYVRGVNNHGLSDFISGNYKTSDNYDELLEHILSEHQNSSIGKFFQEEIMKISGSGPGSVQDRITPLLDRLDRLGIDFGDLENSLQSKVDILQMQMSLFSDAPEWSPLEEYAKDAIVKWDGKLYTAQDIAGIGVEPGTDPVWHRIGDYTSMSDGISDLAMRVSSAETRVEEVEGIVTPVVSQLNAMEAMWREDDEGEPDLGGALENWNSRAAFRQEVKVTANERMALAERITQLSAEMDHAGADIARLEKAIVDETHALAQIIESLTAEMEGEFGRVDAAIYNEQLARVTEDEALAMSIDHLNAQFITKTDELTAGILEEQAVRATETGALATGLSTTQATLNNTRTTVSEHTEAIADIEEGLSAAWGVKVQVDGEGQPLVAGIGLEVTNSTDKPSSAFTVMADRFVIVDASSGKKRIPFFVDTTTGETYINQATFGGMIKSDNFSMEKMEGWALERDTGDAHFYGILNIGKGFHYQGHPVRGILKSTPELITHGGQDINIPGRRKVKKSLTGQVKVEQWIDLGPISDMADMTVQLDTFLRTLVMGGRHTRSTHSSSYGWGRVRGRLEYYVQRVGWVLLKNFGEYDRGSNSNKNNSYSFKELIPNVPVNGTRVGFRLIVDLSAYADGHKRTSASGRARVYDIKMNNSIELRRI